MVLLAFHKDGSVAFPAQGISVSAKIQLQLDSSFKGHTPKRETRFHYGINGRRRIILLPAAQERKALRSGAGSIRCSRRRLPYASLKGQTKSRFRLRGELLQRH
jgi:hypothetical protein